jgi:hypothetical protein
VELASGEVITARETLLDQSSIWSAGPPRRWALVGSVRHSAALVNEALSGRQALHPRRIQGVTFLDVGHPISRIRFSTLQATAASVCWAPSVRVRSRPPSTALYRKKVFSTRP